MKDNNSELRSGGWQINVEYSNDYVIKIPKTRDEISNKISKYLHAKGKISELKERIDTLDKDWKNSLDILSRKNIPDYMLGYPEFLSGGRIKQKRAIIIEDALKDFYKDNRMKDIYNTIEKTLDFVKELWKYGVHEKTGKICFEFGLLGDNIILIDFGELTDKKEVVEKQIRNRKWEKSTKRHLPPEIADYFNKRASEKLTLDTLDKNWRIRDS